MLEVTSRHVTEVTYDIGNSGSHSECTVHHVTVSVGTDSYRHVTEVTYDTGNSGSHSESTVLTVTVSVGSGSYRHVTEVTNAIYSVSFTKRFHFHHSATTPFLHTRTGTFAHPTFFYAQRDYHNGSMEREDIRQNMYTDHTSLVTGF